MEKKASEILLELDQKMDLILGYLKTNDFNYKLIISQLNKLAEGQKSVPPIVPTLKSAVIQDTPPVIVKQEFKNIPQSQGKKTQVQQKITYPDGKVTVLANVEIFDTNNKLIKQTRTNAAGKWNVLLEPGQYTVKVTKPPSTTKPAIEQTTTINVIPSDTLMEV